jgi:hypothetical protein
VNIATHRLHNQRLVGQPFDTPEQAVRWLGAVQAQDYHAAKWALGLRNRGTDDASLDRAFNAGTIVRTHVMRPTWHFVAAEDLRWLLQLTSPRVHTANAHMYRKLELDEAIFRRAQDLFTAVLQGGHTHTRQELAATLESRGIPARGQRLAYIVMHAELSGLLCSGPLRGKQHTYALLEERIRPAPVLAHDVALATLARRYFTSHGPATVHDFAWWSGLRVADARVGVELLGPEIERLVVEDRAYWGTAPITAIDPTESSIHLLPNYDEHVVAYKDHRHTLDPAARESLRTRIDRPLDAHLVARNGLIIGGWRRTREQRSISVTIDLLVALRAPERAALKQASANYSRFIGSPVVLRAAA